MNDGTDFKEKLFISFIILSNFIGSNDTDWIVVLDGMSFFSKETFFCVLIFFKSDVAMIGVGFFFGIFPITLCWEEFNIKNFSKVGEILCDFFFAVIIRDFIDINLVIGEAFFKRDCFSCYFDVS